MIQNENPGESKDGDTIKDILKSAHYQGGKSSDKLALIMAGLSNLPQERMNKISKIKITWEEFVNEEVTICPNLDMEFYE